VAIGISAAVSIEPMKEIEAAGIHIDDTPATLVSKLLEWA
jgi:hypothetical protein